MINQQKLTVPIFLIIKVILKVYIFLCTHFYIIFRPEFSLLNETLNHLEVGVVGTIKNLVRIKNYKFLIHMKLQNCEQINNDEIDLALLNEEIIPL